LGEILNGADGCPFLANSSFVKSGNDNFLIGYDYEGVAIVKYLIQDSGVSLVESVTNDISSANMRLSSNGQELILWGDDLSTNDQRIQIRNLNKLATVKYDRTFPNLVK
jgi:hypothetical protein